MRTWRSCSVASAVVLVAAIAHAEHGVCLAHAWTRGDDGGYGSPIAQKTLERLKKLGVDAVSLTPFGYMRSTTSCDVIMPGARGFGESDARVAAQAKQAHALGMRVMLKPHLWIHGAWCGDAAPTDWARWFDSYRAFIVHYAKLAADEKMEALTLGVELKSASHRDRAAWASIIAEVRAVYRGTLVYAANWDEADHVVFWDLVDEVGVDEYEPGDWPTIIAKLGALASRTRKPIVITEVGYDARKLGADEQAAKLKAALDALGKAPFVRGVYVWKWFTDSAAHDDDSDFSFADRPAEKVLGEAFGRRR